MMLVILAIKRVCEYEMDIVTSLDAREETEIPDIEFIQCRERERETKND